MNNQETMSTNISDLPGPSDETDYEQEQEPQYRQEPEPQYREQYRYRQEPEREQYREPYHDKSKSVRENFETIGLFDILRKDINEENLLIFIIIFLSTSKYTDDYTRQLLSMLSFNVNTSSLTITLIKCALLLLIYVLVKNYLLVHVQI